MHENIDKDHPFVSIVILNYNGLKYVNRCLGSVLRTNYPRFEVIFIDNASTDGSYEYVKQRSGSDPRVKMVKNDWNYGFAKGNNVALKHAKGEYLVFLNVDTEVEPNWLHEMVGTMESDRSLGAAQAKLLRMDDPRRLDTCGHKLTPYGFTYEVGLNEEASHYHEPIEILAGKGAALMVRRSVFEEVGGFDEDFFLLREETDLCWRIWLKGYRIVFIPSAIVFHAVGGTFRGSGIPSIYFFQRNMLVTLIKNLELRNLLRILPIHLFLLLADSLVTDLKNRRACRLPTVLRCLRFIIGNFERIWSKRSMVQKTRKVSDRELFQHIMIFVSLAEKLRERHKI